MDILTIPEAFQSKLRLAIISALISGKKTFNELKAITSSTDGNLSVQLTKLESCEYIAIEKSFQNKKPLTTVSITPKGKAEFKDYVELLQRIVNTTTD